MQCCWFFLYLKRWYKFACDRIVYLKTWYFFISLEFLNLNITLVLLFSVPSLTNVQCTCIIPCPTIHASENTGHAIWYYQHVLWDVSTCISKIIKLNFIRHIGKSSVVHHMKKYIIVNAKEIWLFKAYWHQNRYM